jgi:hypothetical protein
MTLMTHYYTTILLHYYTTTLLHYYTTTLDTTLCSFSGNDNHSGE